jgi:hypothetical protein
MTISCDASRRGPSGNWKAHHGFAGSFVFEGRSVPFMSTDSVASALLRDGVVAFRRSLSGGPRGPFCGIGICYECLVQIDADPARRACMERPKSGGLVRVARR